MFKSKRIVCHIVICACVIGMISGCSFWGKGGEKKKDAKSTASVSPAQTEKKAYTGDEAFDLAKKHLKELSVEEKVGQIFMVNLEQLDTEKGNYYEWRKATDKMKQNLGKYNPSGVILFTRNIENRNQTKKLLSDLQGAAPVPLFTAVDEEGGDVARIGGNPDMGTTSFPTMEEIGKTENADYTRRMAQTIGKEIDELGFNVDFAPVADVRTSMLNIEIGSRSFGDDPNMVAEHVVSYVEGLQGQNVCATLKHFPGQGSSSGDTHIENVDIDKSISGLRRTDFVPFEEGIEAAADFVMVSHISVSKVTETSQPASMSEVIMKTLLREELEFEGLIVTDAMDMVAITENYTAAEAAYSSFKAGADIILMPPDFEAAYNEILGRVKDGSISEERLDETLLRILTLKIKRGILEV